MTRKEWVDTIKGLRPKKKDASNKPKASGRPLNKYKVGTRKFAAYTKSEARAMYKKEVGVIPPGTQFILVKHK